MEHGETIADLQPVGILSFLSIPDLEVLKFYGTFGEYGAGEIIIEQEQKSQVLHIVVAGELDVVVHALNKETKVGDIGPGDCVGEVGILEPGPASATVRVRDTAILWSIDVDQLQQFFETVPMAAAQLLMGISSLLCRRLRHANETILENRILPAHLGVRCGLIKEPIRASSLEKQDRGGLFGGLLGGKKAEPKISTVIKK
jgi:CRP/FNR family transcriptional regulator, cyclic AMP receptor protein